MLVGIARAAPDVATGDRDGRVPVDGVLLADADRERSLLGVRGLETELRCPGTAATELAGRVAADVLRLRLILRGRRLVLRLGVGIRVRVLRRRARTALDVATGNRHRHVGVD